jgi:carboxymethylenebutenolidase
VKVADEEVLVLGEDTEIRSLVIRPDEGQTWPGVLLYTDIFQLTSSTIRTVRRLASYGFVVCAPEIYPRGNLAGVSLAFDEEGKQAGLAAAAATTTAQFDADRTAVLDYLERRADVDGPLRAVGFCLGGHLAFRGAFDARVSATVCFYPTGLHNGALGAERDAGTLAEAGRIRGRLMLVFGSRDPHVPASARSDIVAELHQQQVDFDLHVYAAEHAFMRDEGPRHDPPLTDAALTGAVAFLATSSRPTSPASPPPSS